MVKTKFAITHFMSDLRWSGKWRPAADVYRCAHGWLVKCELAGVTEQDIQLSTQGHYLVVQGCRRDLLVREGHKSHSMEIAYSRFERTIEIPIDVEQASMRTVFQDGMLLIYLE